MEDLKKHDFKADFYITSSGAEIYDQHSNLIYSKAIDQDIISNILEKIFSAKSHTLGIGLRQQHLSFRKETSSIWTPQIVPTIQEAVYTISTKLQTEEAALSFIAELTQTIPISAHANRISVDITALGVSKETGIFKLSEYLNIPSDKIYVIGDSRNDISMIQAYDGYTVHNALDEVKKIAKESFTDVGEMIQKIILK